MEDGNPAGRRQTIGLIVFDRHKGIAGVLGIVGVFAAGFFPFVDVEALLRWQEGDQVMATMAEHMGVKVIRVNAAERYFKALEGVADPEAKRKIIGRLFVEIFDEESAKVTNAGHGQVKWLAQGTIYPDVIESAGSKTGKAHVIKSHHNVGGLPEHMKLKLVEPLRELFKDEVRRIGVELGLPRAMVMDMFVGKLHAKVIRVDASAQFLGHLAGVSEPQ